MSSFYDDLERRSEDERQDELSKSCQNSLD